jgi:hypothetical protein
VVTPGLASTGTAGKSSQQGHMLQSTLTAAATISLRAGLLQYCSLHDGSYPRSAFPAAGHSHVTVLQLQPVVHGGLYLCPCAVRHCVQVVENWYPGSDKDSKGVVLVVTAGKEGAISGGDKFISVSSTERAAQGGCSPHGPYRSCQASGWVGVA